MGTALTLLLVVLVGLPHALWEISHERDVAEEFRHQEATRATEYRRLAYPGHIRQAYLAWKHNNVDLALSLLTPYLHHLR